MVPAMYLVLRSPSSSLLSPDLCPPPQTRPAYSALGGVSTTSWLTPPPPPPPRLPLQPTEQYRGACCVPGAWLSKCGELMSAKWHIIIIFLFFIIIILYVLPLEPLPLTSDT
ncbi:unnamed protein product, partial [Coregonus sp. 'balchen']